MALPQSNVELLHKRLAAIFDAPTPPSEFTLKSLYREAEKSIAQDPMIGHQLCGVVRALEGLEHETREHFRVSAQFGKGLEWYGNWATALMCLGYVEESARQMLLATEARPGDAFVMRNCLLQQIVAGEISLAFELEQDLRRLVVNDAQSEAWVASRVFEAIQATGVPEAEVKAAFVSACEVMREHGLRYWKAKATAEANTELPAVTLEFYIPNLDAHQAVDLHRSWATRLIEAWPHKRHFDELGVDFMAC